VSTEVAVQGNRNLPALASTPALDIGAEDVALPRLYIGQKSSDAVGEGLVQFGDIFIASGKDDPAPNIIAKKKSKDGNDPSDGPVFHVLGMWRGKSVTIEGQLYTYAYNDPSAPDNAWTTYNYTLAMPEIDTDVPVKYLLTRSGAPAAKNMNMALMRNQARGPAYELAFRLGTRIGSNDKGQWYSPSVVQVEANEEHVAVAANLAALVAGSAHQMDDAATGDEPAI
jgi:hypothetical protein